MKKVLFLFCVGIALAAANGVRADDLVVDNYERLSVVATNGDMTAASIFSAPKAVARPLAALPKPATVPVPPFRV